MKFNRYKTGGGNKNILKFSSGKDVRLVCRGDLKEFNQHWILKRPYLCPEDASCQHCLKGDKPKFTFRVNCLINENGAYTAKILEGGWQIYNQLAALAEAGYELPETILKVNCVGDGLQREYTVVALPGKQGTVTPEQKKQFANIPMIPLTEGEAEQPQSGDDDQDSNEDAPF